MQSRLLDFNADGLKDLVVVSSDGTVSLAKNYGGTIPYQSLETLMVIAESVEELFVGDVDGNGYEDLLFKLTKGQLLAYLNKGGEFALDGKLVCLNANVAVGQEQVRPDDVSGIFQLFLEDMDRDGNLDIITNDVRGLVKIFYGGAHNGLPHYLSTGATSCDA